MVNVKDTPSIALIGDLMGSRESADRAVVHARFETALEQVNHEFSPVVPLRITAGDECQGIFGSLGAALVGSLRLRLALLPEIDVRQGIGWGSVMVLGESPRVEDGPGWWAARAAIETVEAYERKPSHRVVRTAFALAEGEEGPDPDLVNAALMLRDQVVSGLSPRSLSVLAGLMVGKQQQEIADALGISASAVSQRVRGDGIGILLATEQLLGGLG